MGPFGPGIRRICAVAAASTAAEMRWQIKAGLRETPTIELRLDWLKNDLERDRLLRWLKGLASPRRAVFIVTCRRREGGGEFPGSVAEQMRWLARAREAGCQWWDVEVESRRGSNRGRASAADSQRGPGLPLRHKPARVLLSLHDFRRTPPLGRAPAALRDSAADAVKIATHARTIGDSVRTLRVARRLRNLVAIPMGEIGLPARILSLREGSALAYASVAHATAPGQVSLWDFKHLYRAHQLNRATRVYGVIGYPVAHSLSPLLHNTGFAATRLNAVYLPFLVKDLADFLKALPEFGLRGFSITLPHKAAILKHLDECEPLAADIGAANTVVVRRDGLLYGCNTDFVGVLRSLEKKFPLEGSRVLIFGAGGAARAAAFAVARAGAGVSICARRESAARSLARAVGGEIVPRRALRTARFDAILNATPIGMHPHDQSSPLTARELNCRLVMDLIYRPERTKLLQIAASKGIATVPGLEMFLAQGIAQWELWMKRRAPEPAMRRAVVAALRAETKQRRSR